MVGVRQQMLQVQPQTTLVQLELLEPLVVQDTHLLEVLEVLQEVLVVVTTTLVAQVL